MNFSGEVVKIEVDPLFFKQKSKLREKRDKSYSCGKCDYVATQSGNLKTHIRSKHEGVRYLCSHCEYATTQAGHLKRHIENRHEGVRYSCDQCENVATGVHCLI